MHVVQLYTYVHTYTNFYYTYTYAAAHIILILGLVYRNKLRFMWRESFVWLYVVRFAWLHQSVYILKYTGCQYKNTFLTSYTQPEHIPENWRYELYENIIHNVVYVHCTTYVYIYINRAIYYTHIQTAKTATYIYSCNLSGLGELLQSMCMHKYNICALKA